MRVVGLVGIGREKPAVHSIECAAVNPDGCRRGGRLNPRLSVFPPGGTYHQVDPPPGHHLWPYQGGLQTPDTPSRGETGYPSPSRAIAEGFALLRGWALSVANSHMAGTRYRSHCGHLPGPCERDPWRPRLSADGGSDWQRRAAAWDGRWRIKAAHELVHARATAGAGDF